MNGSAIVNTGYDTHSPARRRAPTVEAFDTLFASQLESSDGTRTGRKQNTEGDVTMTTVLQPSEMLKSELTLHEAARNNEVDKVRELLAKKTNVNSKNNLDRTALQWAAANGHVAVMELLVKAQADIEAQDKYGMSALLWCAWFGHLDATRMLINAGANTSIRNRQGMNILHCSAYNNHVKIPLFIHDTIDNYDMNQLEKNDRTPLHLAAERGNLETVEKLLDFKCEINKKDKEGRTAVHLAAMHGHQHVLKKLLLFGVEVDDRDSDGMTALHVAAEAGHTAASHTLLATNADANAETTKGNTPLHVAASNGHNDVIQVLIDHQCNLNAQNNQGNTAVHLASINNHPQAVLILVDNYAQLDIPNNRSHTPLHTAVENGLADCVEVLLVAGADIEAKERSGKSPLHMASRGSYIGIVDMIIKADRYYAHDGLKDVASRHSDRSSVSSVTFRRAEHNCTELMKDVLWRLATKQLKSGEWKKLAFHWGFTENHIKAIEHQYTGAHSYKEHGYRLLLIWLHGVKKDDNPMKNLYEALVAIGRRDLGDQMRKRSVQGSNYQNSNGCIIS